MSRSSEKELLENVKSEIQSRLTWEMQQGNLNGLSRDKVMDELSDMMDEIIDNNLPTYYSDMAELLADNLDFSTVDDEVLLPDNPSVWDIITISIYEFLSAEYYTLAGEAIEELLPELE